MWEKSPFGGNFISSILEWWPNSKMLHICFYKATLICIPPLLELHTIKVKLPWGQCDLVSRSYPQCFCFFSPQVTNWALGLLAWWSKRQLTVSKSPESHSRWPSRCSKVSVPGFHCRTENAARHVFSSWRDTWPRRETPDGGEGGPDVRAQDAHPHWPSWQHC